MSWVKIDDAFDEHPKIIGLSPLAVTLHIRSLCWIARYLTDGYIPKAALQRLAAGLYDPAGDDRAIPRKPDPIADELSAAGLWEQNGAGWVIHDYLKYNPKRADVEAERRRTSNAKRQAGVKSGLMRRTKAEQKLNRTGTEREQNMNPDPDPLPLPQDQNQLLPPYPPKGDAAQQNFLEPEVPTNPTPKGRAANRSAEPPGFSEIWNLYPKHRRTGKFRARQYWRSQKLEPKLDLVRAGLETHLRSKDWTKEEGKYVPAFNKFLREGRWEDEPLPQDPDPLDF